METGLQTLKSIVGHKLQTCASWGDIPDSGLDLETFLSTKDLGLSKNQISNLDNVKISFTELTSGQIKTMNPSAFKAYLKADITNIPINGLTPSTLGTTKKELLEGVLELIRKQL